MNLRVHVDSSDPTPPFEQLRRQLADLIRTGTLVDGQRLPSVRQLAADLSLAAGTVARAYAELEKGGLVLSRRGAGTRVIGSKDPVSGGVTNEHLLDLVNEITQLALALDLTPETLTGMVEHAMQRQS